jgi:hypothetical protein
MMPILADQPTFAAIGAVRGANMGARLSRATKKAKRRAHRTSRVKQEAQYAAPLPYNGLRSQKIADGLSLKRAERRPSNDR